MQEKEPALTEQDRPDDLLRVVQNAVVTMSWGITLCQVRPLPHTWTDMVLALHACLA